MADQPDLAAELDALKVVLARRIRERLDAEKSPPPAFLDVARRFLLDNTPKATRAPLAPPLVTDLPFPDEHE